MNKIELINELNDMTNLTKKECKTCLDSILFILKDALNKGNEINISNFGKLSVKEKKQRLIYNPLTKEYYMTKKKFVPTFKPSSALKIRVS